MDFDSKESSQYLKLNADSKPFYSRLQAENILKAFSIFEYNWKQ